MKKHIFSQDLIVLQKSANKTVEKFVKFWNEIMKKPEPTRIRIIDQIKVGDSVQLKYASEEDIRTTAYYLWEQNGKTGDSGYWWIKAEEYIREKMKAY
jgi:radical SAM superfamily enzyme YgiQ (UPF0313 family)